MTKVKKSTAAIVLGAVLTAGGGAMFLMGDEAPQITTQKQALTAHPTCPSQSPSAPFKFSTTVHTIHSGNGYYIPAFNGVEEIGDEVGSLFFREVLTVYNPDSANWLQLIQHKGAGGTTTVTVVDLRKGTVVGALTGLDINRVGAYHSGSKTVQGRVYFSTISAAYVLEYDATTNKFTNHGRLYEKDTATQSVTAHKDGTVVFGSIGSAEVSLFDSKNSSIRNYGRVGMQGGYAYTIGQSETAIHVATRAGEWQWYAVEKETGKQTMVYNMPSVGQAFIQILSDGYARIRQPNGGPFVTYHYSKGVLSADATYTADPLPWPTPPRAPTVELSKSIAVNEAYVDIDWRYTSTTAPQRMRIPTAISPSNIRSLAKSDDDEIYITQRSYGTLARYAPKNGRFERLGFIEISTKDTMVTEAGLVAGAGYPSSSIFKYDPASPFVYTPETPRGAFSVSNPARILASSATGDSHDLTGFFEGADGYAYYLAHRDRYVSGYRLGRIDLQTGVYEQIDLPSEAEEDYESWMSHSSEGVRLVISAFNPSTYESVLIVYNVVKKTFRILKPNLNGHKILGPHVIKGNRLIGIAVDPAKYSTRFLGTSSFYELKLKDGCLTKFKTYERQISEVPSKNTSPRYGHGISIGPKGNIWTAYNLGWAASPEAILKVNPKDFSVTVLGTVPNAGTIRYLFHDGYAYITGGTKLRRFPLPKE